MSKKTQQNLKCVSFAQGYEDDIYYFSKTLPNFSQFVKEQLKKEMMKQILEGNYKIEDTYKNV